MGKTLALVLVLLIAIGTIGFWRGWFEFQTNKAEGKVHADFSVNKEKFKQDKEILKKKVAERSKALKDKLASLRGQAKSLSGDAKAKADREIADLTKSQENLEAKLKDVEEVTEDKFENLKHDLATTLEDKNNDSQKEADKPK
jgi:hypothetical protein